MKINTAIVATNLVTFAHAWSYSSGPSAGIYETGSTQQQQVLAKQTNDPNATTSVPVSLAGGHNFTLRVNVSDISLAGVNSSISQPRAVLTTYDVDGADGSSFNDTFENPGPSCFTTTSTAFRKKVTKKSKADGDCSDAFGQDCVSALENYSPNCDTSFSIPSQCQDAFKSIDSTFQFEMSGRNGSDPLNIYAYDSDVLSASDSKKQYEQASEQMYFVLFRTGQRPSVAVCVRATSGSMTMQAVSMSWSLLAAVAVAGWISG